MHIHLHKTHNGTNRCDAMIRYNDREKFKKGVDKLTGEIEHIIMHVTCVYNSILKEWRRPKKERYLNVFSEWEVELPDDSPEVTGQRCSESLKPTSGLVRGSAFDQPPDDPAPSSRGAASLPTHQPRMPTRSRRHLHYRQPTVGLRKAQVLIEEEETG